MHVENIYIAKIEAPGNKKMRFYDGLNFKKKVAGEQGLALQQHFPKKYFKSSKKFKQTYELTLKC